MRYILIYFCCMLATFVSAQEFLANVKVDYSQVQNSNTTSYQALEKSLKDFINTTKWTDKTFKLHEKIEANFTIIIREKEGSNRYKASILVQSRRPVYNSTYYTPILNLEDSKFSFEYTDYEQLVFNPRKFSGKNLTDVIGYYVYLILGYDADTFQKMGGTEYFKTAQGIASYAQSSRYDGWAEMEGPRSRASLINEILAPSNSTLRNVYYSYQMQGLDRMSSSEVNAKNAIGRALLSLDFYKKNNNYTQNYPLDIFFMTKKGEITQIFTGGLKSNFGVNQLANLLNTISPTNSKLWNKLDS